MSRDNIEHGWIVGKYGCGSDSREPICYCEWCDAPIYYKEDVNCINGWKVCDACREKRETENEEVWQNP